MTGEIKTTLEFENYKLLPFLFGDHDRNIARIEQKLRVSIGCFGDQIEIKGSEKGVNQAVAAIEALYKKLDLEGNTECIDFDIVDAAIEWILTSTDEHGKPDLAGFDNPNFRLETWKRRIVPRSPNQHTYVKALLESEVTLGIGPAGTGKTYVSIYKALQDVLRRGTPYNKLIIINPTVDVGNEDKLGFLPGELDKKIQQYNE